MQFSETQRFRQGWNYAILALVFFAVIAVPIITAYKTHQPDMVWMSVIGGFMILSLIAITYWSRMDIRVDYSGISLRYTPFVWKEKIWNWGDIKAAYVRTYNPLLEYGGWGLKNTFKNGRAYNVAGNKGLQLELENGKKVLIGTQKAEELEQMLQYLRSHHKLNMGKARD